jgi:hypothetical protein
MEECKVDISNRREATSIEICEGCTEVGRIQLEYFDKGMLFVEADLELMKWIRDECNKIIEKAES